MRATFAFSTVLHARTTRSPRAASCFAAEKPTPLFAPVTRTAPRAAAGDGDATTTSSSANASGTRAAAVDASAAAPRPRTPRREDAEGARDASSAAAAAAAASEEEEEEDDDDDDDARGATTRRSRDDDVAIARRRRAVAAARAGTATRRRAGSLPRDARDAVGLSALARDIASMAACARVSRAVPSRCRERWITLSERPTSTRDELDGHINQRAERPLPPARVMAETEGREVGFAVDEEARARPSRLAAAAVRFLVVVASRPREGSNASIDGRDTGPASIDHAVPAAALTPSPPTPPTATAVSVVVAQGWVVGAYLVGDAKAPTAVVLAADAAGWRAPGVRRFARKLARDGVLVATPDLWRGDTWHGDPSPSKRGGAAFDQWAKEHPAELAAKDMASVVTALRERGATRVACVGVGWGAGAAAAALLSGQPGVDGAIDAGAIACPLGVSVKTLARAMGGTAPCVLVWGGGDAIGAAARRAAEEEAGVEAAGKWGFKAFEDAGGDFVFAERAEGEACAAEDDAAALVMEWALSGAS